MSAALEKAKKVFNSDDYAIVLTDGPKVFTSKEKGVIALLALASDGVRCDGWAAADKVIGKGAAYMYILLGVKEVYTPVMSSLALELLSENDIEIHFDSLVKMIKNRSGDGPCLMEVAVMDAENENDAFERMKKTAEKMKNVLQTE